MAPAAPHAPPRGARHGASGAPARDRCARQPGGHRHPSPARPAERRPGLRPPRGTVIR
ncbi:hypothetical protein [Ornithinimicrobium kibberense]|uniref:hypothetical protein n=1 Tax=Ornithinimicrobium kibberense TaxID=282060 RepID=UPI00361E31C5